MQIDPLPESGGPMMPLRVLRKARIAEDVFLFALAHRDGAPLPPFSAGAHITVLTPNGLTRRYSLCNGPDEVGEYLIAVKRDAAGLGGSVSVADHVQEGDVLPSSRPINHFPLQPGARSYLLIAGGIGITPLRAMLRELLAQRLPVELVYLARTPESAAFHDELAAPELAARVWLHHDHGDSRRLLDLSPWLAQAPDGRQVYCCGPRGLMQAVREATQGWPAGTVHFEDFGTTPDASPACEDRSFSVKLARTKRTLQVPAGATILQVLRANGVLVPSSCESGTCGSCRTGLLSGVADHRDYVLDEEEHGTEIMICVSRAATAELELDL